MRIKFFLIILLICLGVLWSLLGCDGERNAPTPNGSGSPSSTTKPGGGPGDPANPQKSGGNPPPNPVDVQVVWKDAVNAIKADPLDVSQLKAALAKLNNTKKTIGQL